MKCLHDLWKDELGGVLTAEVVMLGTLGVVGATVGLSAAGKSVNSEMEEFAFSLRSFDQSYTIAPRQGCGSWTAGSCYRQRPVKESHAELQSYIDKESRRQRRAERAAREDGGEREREREARPPMEPPVQRRPEEPRREVERRWDGDERRHRQGTERREGERRRGDDAGNDHDGDNGTDVEELPSPTA